MSSRQMRRRKKDDLSHLETEQDIDKQLAQPKVQKNLFNLVILHLMTFYKKFIIF